MAHRYVGLIIGVFLVSAGLSGSLLAWKDAIEVAVNPELQRASPPTVGAQALDPLTLRERVLARHHGASIPDVPLATAPGRSAEFFLEWPDAGAAPHDEDVFVDPFTGEELGSRHWGDMAQGRKNLVPFLYRLHYSLASGIVGNYLFGLVALLWTLDCFVGLCISLPAARAHAGLRGAPSAIARWASTWTVRRHGGTYKRVFDLHRAGAMWLWAMLFVFAWSAVSFNLREVYRPVMGALFDHQPNALPPATATPSRSAPDWRSARERGRELMQQEAQQRHFVVRQEASLGYDDEADAFCYDVRSSLDVGGQDGRTRVCFDARSGARLGAWLPTGAARGDTLDAWLTVLHRARLGGAPYRVFVSALGLAVAALAASGLFIWWRKRRGRLAVARLRAR